MGTTYHIAYTYYLNVRNKQFNKIVANANNSKNKQLSTTIHNRPMNHRWEVHEPINYTDVIYFSYNRIRF